MKILISPAKKLNFDQEEYPIDTTTIDFGEQAEKLIKKLKRLKPQAIADLMHLSPALADLNYERYQNWNLPFDTAQIKPAVFAFDGEVYSGLDIRSFTSEELKKCQEQLMILSGLYGILKPMDNILPYRLEMGTSLNYSSSKKNLYQFWGDTLTKELLSNLAKDEVIVNLASAEYAKAINFKKVKNPIITPVFKDFDGKIHKIIMVYAKQARGAMTQFIVKNDCNTAEDLKSFNGMGYEYDATLSTEDQLVFTR